MYYGGAIELANWDRTSGPNAMWIRAYPPDYKGIIGASCSLDSGYINIFQFEDDRAVQDHIARISKLQEKAHAFARNKYARPEHLNGDKARTQSLEYQMGASVAAGLDMLIRTTARKAMAVRQGDDDSDDDGGAALYDSDDGAVYDDDDRIFVPNNDGEHIPLCCSNAKCPLGEFDVLVVARGGH